MNKTKCWQLLLGLLALLGVSLTSTQLKYKNSLKNQKKPLSGKWLITLENCSIKKELRITPEGEVFIDQRKIKGEITESTENHFHFVDHFGYEMELYEDDQGKLVFYDEAGDKKYMVESI